MARNLISELNFHNGLPRMLVLRELCPVCRATEFQTSMSHPLTSLLALFSIRPVRCMNCWRRYYWLTRRHFNRS